MWVILSFLVRDVLIINRLGVEFWQLHHTRLESMVFALGWQVRLFEGCLFNCEILMKSVVRFCCEEALSRSHNRSKPIPQVLGDVREDYGYLPPIWSHYVSRWMRWSIPKVRLMFSPLTMSHMNNDAASHHIAKNAAWRQKNVCNKCGMPCLKRRNWRLVLASLLTKWVYMPSTSFKHFNRLVRCLQRYISRHFIEIVHFHLL